MVLGVKKAQILALVRNVPETHYNLKEILKHVDFSFIDLEGVELVYIFDLKMANKALGLSVGLS